MAGRVRAVGRRLPFQTVPAPVRAWVTGIAGEVSVAGEHRGGMSPGCATSLRTADGGLLFVKAVGVDQNTQTVELFRYETGIRRRGSTTRLLRRRRDPPARRRRGTVLVGREVPGRYCPAAG